MTAHKTFEHRSRIPTTAQALMDFHSQPDTLRQLTLPPTRIQIILDRRDSLISGDITFKLWLGPVPVRWVARHEPGPIATAFTDRMLSGPMETWIHQHIFQPGTHGAELIDRITFAHKHGWRGWLTRLMFDGLPLRLLFIYRHWRTRRAVTRTRRETA